MSADSPLVKICGVREVRHAVTAREAGADLVGMIFADARRRVDIKTARAIRRELGPRVEIIDSTTDAVERGRARSGRPLLVGVFARQTPDEILRVLERVDLDLVQLSGGEHPALAGRIPRAVRRMSRRPRPPRRCCATRRARRSRSRCWMLHRSRAGAPASVTTGRLQWRSRGSGR